MMYSVFGKGRRFRGPVVLGIREFSRKLEFESSYTLIEHAPDDSIQLEILPEALGQVRRLNDSISEGRYRNCLNSWVLTMLKRARTRKSGRSKRHCWPIPVGISSAIPTSTINSTVCLPAGLSRRRREEDFVCRLMHLPTTAIWSSTMDGCMRDLTGFCKQQAIVALESKTWSVRPLSHSHV